MSKYAYYNEHDRNAAQWLRELIKLNLIAPGEVDERSIVDVDPTELKSFNQQHFFAGIGVWSYALRQAGWDDDRPVVTGSCPCQSFSVAGKRRGFDDERHLWPYMFRIVKELRPNTIFGEQVSSAGALAWWDLVASDLESADYAATAIDLSGASIGAPHIRSRLFWMGHSQHDGQYEKLESRGADEKGRVQQFERPSAVNIMADSNGQQSKSGIASISGQGNRSAQRDSTTEDNSSPSTFWDDCQWLPCRDGKHRAVKSGISPLVDGTTVRVGHSSDPSIESVENTQEARTMRLKGYGNAIVAPLAIEFVSAAMETIDKLIGECRDLNENNDINRAIDNSVAPLLATATSHSLIGSRSQLYDLKLATISV